MYNNTYKGKYKVINEEKYRGDVNNVIYRSGWEYSVLQFLDKNPRIKSFSSEEIVIPYRSPVDGEIHRYFVDIAFEDTKGRKVLVEIKPYDQTIPPKLQQRKTRLYLKKVQTYMVNKAKWASAKRFCKKKGWVFTIWTERELKKFGLMM